MVERSPGREARREEPQRARTALLDPDTAAAKLGLVSSRRLVAPGTGRELDEAAPLCRSSPFLPKHILLVAQSI